MKPLPVLNLEEKKERRDGRRGLWQISIFHAKTSSECGLERPHFSKENSDCILHPRKIGRLCISGPARYHYQVAYWSWLETQASLSDKKQSSLSPFSLGTGSGVKPRPGRRVDNSYLHSHSILLLVLVSKPDQFFISSIYSTLELTSTISSH